MWSREDWVAIAEASKNIKTYVTHVDAHTSKTDPIHSHSDNADKLAALMTSKLTIFNMAPWKVTNTSNTKVTLQHDPDWQIHTPIPKTKLVNKHPWSVKNQEDTKVTLHHKPLWHFPKPPTSSNISSSEILDLHRLLGHRGMHALFSCATFRNIPITWHQCKVAISKCPDYPQQSPDLNFTLPTLLISQILLITWFRLILLAH
jgi:hypothetical protein